MTERPPKFFTRLFKWFCEDDFFEELQGDLEEKFFENIERIGSFRAKLVYQKEILKMLRPSVMRKPKLITSISPLSLFQVHLKLAFRNIYRQKAFSLVNIVSLATAITLCLFAVNMIYTGYQSDKQHYKAEALYRVTTKVESQKSTETYATSAYALYQHLEDIPQIEQSAFFITNLNTEFDVKGETIELIGYAADNSFFEIFSFDAIAGDPKAVFNDLRSIAITDKAAKMLFGDSNPIGKTDNQGLVIKAVIKSPDKNSHLKFDFLYNIAFRDRFMTQEELSTWDTYDFDSYNYFRLADNADIIDVNNQLIQASELMNEQMPKTARYSMIPQKVASIMFGESFLIDMQNIHPRTTLLVLSSIIIVLIVLASFNYANLSIAQSLRRSKEIGIRRITGGNRWQIIVQLITETCVFSCIALGLAILAYHFILPRVEQNITTFDTLLSTELSSGILLWFLLFSLIVGVLSGLLPAIHFSNISPLSAIQHKLKKGNYSLSNTKRVLVSIQLGVSTLCILFIVIINDQKDQIFNADLGFESSGLIALGTKGIDIDLLKAQLDQLPEVTSYTATSMIPGTNSNMRGRIIISANSQDTARVDFALVDTQFPEVYGIKVKTGPGFTPEAHDEVLVDDLFLTSMNIPADSAIGTLVYINEYRAKVPVKIVGILKGFNHTSLTAYPIPKLLRNHYDSTITNTLTLDIFSKNLPATLKKIEADWNAISTDQVFSPVFVEDAIERSYASYFSIVQIIKMGGMAIVLIAVLGQFGIALFSAENRIKEISIRKVLGANLHSLIGLFSKNTLLTLVLTTTVALPLTLYIIDAFVRPHFSISLDIPVLKMAVGLFTLWTAIILIVIAQTWFTARINPAQTLKND